MIPCVYEGHVKIVGIIEIVGQVLLSLICLIVIILLSSGTSLIASVSSSLPTRVPSGFPENGYGGHYGPVPWPAGAITGLLIGLIIFVVLIVAFRGWLVWLIYTGGQTKNASRLTMWYIVQCVLLVVTLILDFVVSFTVLPWYFIILSIGLTIYRIYSIHVVRLHAAELKNFTTTV